MAPGAARVGMMGGEMRRVWILGVAIAAGCGGASRGGGGAAAPGAEARAVLVWHWSPRPAHDEGAPTVRTVWLEPDGAGGVRVAGERAELVFAAGERLWVWREQPIEVETCDCECVEGGGEGGAGCARREPAREGVLVELGGAGAQVALTEAQGGSCEDGIGESSCQALPLGGVGPYLFVGDVCHEYACGAAHGDFGWTFTVLDLETGKPVDLLTPAERAELAAAADAEARRELTPEDPELGGMLEDELELTLYRPRLDGDHVTLEVQMTAHVPYAASDGNWHAYTASAMVDAPRLPAAFAAWRAVPAAAERWLAEHPPGEGDVVGFSVVSGPAARVDAVRARFVAR
jgi:hypothetical protein